MTKIGFPHSLQISFSKNILLLQKCFAYFQGNIFADKKRFACFKQKDMRFLRSLAGMIKEKRIKSTSSVILKSVQDIAIPIFASVA
jgi:hypothetical protein